MSPPERPNSLDRLSNLSSLHRVPLFILACISCISTTSQAQVNERFVEPTQNWIQDQLPSLLETYYHLHRNPEVSFQEIATAKYVAQAWREAGFEVTEQFGGTGVVAILRNGPGSTVMLRTDLDALPVTEVTGLAYASQATVTTESGATTGVMHACGHDIHMTNLIGVARFLGSHRQAWSGTLMLVGQPAEERGAGARAMLEAGLFEHFPKPDFALALHCDAAGAAGTVALSPGFSLANVDSVDIVVHGRGGHGSAPESTIDPIVQAAQLVMDLQTIVSREIKPSEPAVVTVGSIHGGTKHNIIGDRCHLQLTVRSYSAEVRQQLLSAIKRKALAVAESFAAPPPEITQSEGTPALENDAALTSLVSESFRKVLGSSNVLPMPPVMGGEDFSQYGLAGVPIVMYRLGVISPERLSRYESLGVNPPSLHSPNFFPDPQEALKVGILTMATATMDLLPRP
ncbi:M20 metallopeptidase family protein [Aureliella helgolandensis]|uniref:Putative hydrolase YxeP n=1 Tax=Aureliella helgolandensis TaxID=2527968 RepID=A0A518G530_9BACT|nr:amidohydrolase [Aureliella helgolandensis]QDV23670.1 putative hydrolase YxeP [Aureliella helgolandensis]